MVSDGRQLRTPERNKEFETVFERYYRPVSYYFAHRGFSPDECKDLAQETFLRAYRRWEQYQRTGDGEQAWIFTIAANLYRNTIRSRLANKRNVQKRSLSELLELGMDPVDTDDDPATLAIQNERRRLIIERLEELPPRMRQCFVLRFGHGWKYREIADVMQISLQSVRSQLHLAKTRLRELFQQP